MNAAPVSPLPTIAPPPRRPRWWLRGLLLFIALLIGVPTLTITYMVYSANNAWDAAVEEATALDPRWKLLEIEEDRPTVPNNENAALYMIALRRKAGGLSISGAPRYELIFEKLSPNAQLNAQQIQLIRGQLTLLGKALEEARKLKDMPDGRVPIKFSDDFMSTLMPEHQNLRTVADWLSHDAFDLAQEQKYDEAVESCQALLNAGRVLKDDAMLISMLIRIAMQTIAVHTLERVLAQGEPSDETLKVTQAILEREYKSSGWVQAIRGERAGTHHLFDNIRSGKVQSGQFFRGWMNGAPINATNVINDMFPSTLMHAYPGHLKHMTRCVEIAKLPIHERGPKMKEWESDSRTSNNNVIRMLAPALGKCHGAEARGQAWLRSAMTVLACERYRQKHDKWPATLDELVKEKLLDAVPTDPMDGQPLRYLKTKEGVVIYGLGVDKIDHQGNINHDKSNMAGFDVGFRLWDVDLRRRAPLPPVALPEGNNP